MFGLVNFPLCGESVIRLVVNENRLVVKLKRLVVDDRRRTVGVQRLVEKVTRPVVVGATVVVALDEMLLAASVVLGARVVVAAAVVAFVRATLAASVVAADEGAALGGAAVETFLATISAPWLTHSKRRKETAKREGGECMVVGRRGRRGAEERA